MSSVSSSLQVLSHVLRVDISYEIAGCVLETDALRLIRVVI